MEKEQDPPGIDPNRSTSQLILADGVSAATLSAEQRHILQNTQLSVVESRMRMLRLPIGVEQYHRRFVKELMQTGPRFD